MSKQDFEKLRAHAPELVDAVVAHVVRHGLTQMIGWRGIYLRLLCEASDMYQRCEFKWSRDLSAAAFCVVTTCGDSDVALVDFAEECHELAAAQESIASIEMKMRVLGCSITQTTGLLDA